MRYRGRPYPGPDSGGGCGCLLLLVVLTLPLVAPSCGGGGSGPPPVTWIDTSIDTVEGSILVRHTGVPTSVQVESVRRRVFETWRDCRRLEGDVVQLCEAFRPADVLVWNHPSEGDRYGGRIVVNGETRWLVFVGQAGWMSSLNHEVGDHAACHYDEDLGLGLVPAGVSCAVVGHPGWYRLDGTPLSEN